MGQVRLQGIGLCDGKPVKELKVGDVIEWNFGYTSTVLELHPTKTGKQINVLLKSDSGMISNRRMGSERLVAVR